MCKKPACWGQNFFIGSKHPTSRIFWHLSLCGTTSYHDQFTLQHRTLLNIFIFPNPNIQEQWTTLQTIPVFPVKLAFYEAVTPAWLDKALGGPLLCLSQRGKINSLLKIKQITDVLCDNKNSLCTKHILENIWDEKALCQTLNKKYRAKPHFTYGPTLFQKFPPSG